MSTRSLPLDRPEPQHLGLLDLQGSVLLSARGKTPNKSYITALHQDGWGILTQISRIFFVWLPPLPWPVLWSSATPAAPNCDISSLAQQHCPAFQKPALPNSQHPHGAQPLLPEFIPALRHHGLGMLTLQWCKAIDPYILFCFTVFTERGANPEPVSPLRVAHGMISGHFDSRWRPSSQRNHFPSLSYIEHWYCGLEVFSGTCCAFSGTWYVGTCPDGQVRCLLAEETKCLLKTTHLKWTE